MIRMILAFLLIFAFFVFGIDIVRKMSKQEKLGLTKLLGYGIVCTVITMVVITSIVLIF
jgi:hypothetical protein